MAILLGCIADDLTGATDVALMLATHGMNVVLVIGVPKNSDPVDADAVVVALKSRTARPSLAVQESSASADWLLSRGAGQLYFKYCSTFDSTDAGNIGPVASALLEQTRQDFTVVVPAFPANGRTVYNGHLFVGNQLLSESGMQHHPLTPMRDAYVPRVLQNQVQEENSVGLIPQKTVAQGAAAIRDGLHALKNDSIRYAVIDSIADEDLHHIGSACDDLALVTGGSGLAMGLPENYRRHGKLADGHGPVALPATPGPVALLAGSCSETTRAQIAEIKSRVASVTIDPRALLTGTVTIEEISIQAGDAAANGAVLVSSSAPPDNVHAVQEEFGRERVSDVIETATGTIAAELKKRGVRKFIIAGGETAGAVAQALGLSQLDVGPEIEPGVPWTITKSEPQLLIAFKSGNFGSHGFFKIAMDMLS